MTASVLASRILGYVRDAVIAARHGATSETDVYFASFTLPDLMAYMINGGALSIVFLPMFAAFLAKDQEEQAWDCFGVVATTMGVVVVVATTALWVLAPMLAPLILPGFTEQQIADTVTLTRIVLPAQLFFYAGGLLSATVMARERFAEYAFVPIIYNLCIILGGLLLGPSLGIAGFSWGALVGSALGPFGLMLWAARKRGLRFRPRFDVTNPHFITFLLRSLPVLVGFSLVAVDEWVSRYYASSLDNGSITWLQNARRLMLVPVSVLGQAAGTAALPFLTRLHAEGKDREMASVLGDSLRVVAFATLAAGAWMAVTAGPVVGLFFERGEFSALDTTQSASALMFFSFGIVFWGLQALVVRGFYAVHSTWTPMLISLGTTALVLPLYGILSRRMGHDGLALSTSIGMAVLVMALCVGLLWRVPLGVREVGLSVLRSAVVCAAAGAAAWSGLRAVGSYSYLVDLSIASAIFGTVLAGLATVLKLPEWTALTGRLLSRLRR